MHDFSGTTCSLMINQALRQKEAVAVRTLWGSGECVFLQTAHGDAIHQAKTRRFFISVI